MARLETIDASTTTDTLAARAEALGAVFASRAARTLTLPIRLPPRTLPT